MMMRKSKDALVSNLRLQPSMLKMQLEQLQLQQKGCLPSSGHCRDTVGKILDSLINLNMSYALVKMSSLHYSIL